MRKYNEIDAAINIDGTLQKTVFLQNDVDTLIEYIRRARDEGNWTTEGLHFYEVKPSDLFGQSQG